MHEPAAEPISSYGDETQSETTCYIYGTTHIQALTPDMEPIGPITKTQAL